MSQAFLPFTATLLFALVVFRWTAEETKQQGELSDAAAAAVAALVALHAGLTLVCAGSAALAIDLPAPVRLGLGAPVGIVGAVLVTRAVRDIPSLADHFRGRTADHRARLTSGWALILIGAAVASASVPALVLALLPVPLFRRLARGGPAVSDEAPTAAPAVPS